MKTPQQKFYLLSILFVFFSSLISAQTVQKIGENSMSIDPNAVLELESTTKGFLLPRVALTATTNIAPMSGTITAGMSIYNTATIADVTPGFYYWNAIKWIRVADSGAVSATSITGIVPILNGGTGTSTATGTGSTVLSASPTFTGAPVLPTGTIGITQTTGDNSTALATTAFVTTASSAIVADAINDETTTIAPSQNAVYDALTLKAPLISPTFTGEPVAPTATSGTNSTQLATTEFVNNSISAATVINAHLADYTALPTDSTILFNTFSAANVAGYTITLPTPSTLNNGKIYSIRKTDSSNNKLNFSPSIYFSTGEFFTSLNYSKTIRIQSDGNKWNLID